jgi:hypothetical protein
MRSDVIDIVRSVIDTPKLGSLGETESPKMAAPTAKLRRNEASD